MRIGVSGRIERRARDGAAAVAREADVALPVDAPVAAPHDRVPVPVEAEGHGARAARAHEACDLRVDGREPGARRPGHGNAARRDSVSPNSNPLRSRSTTGVRGARPARIAGRRGRARVDDRAVAVAVTAPPPEATSHTSVPSKSPMPETSGVSATVAPARPHVVAAPARRASADCRVSQRAPYQPPGRRTVRALDGVQVPWPLHVALVQRSSSTQLAPTRWYPPAHS